MKTDSDLQSDVLQELKWWPSVNAAHGVAAKDGVVTLTGQVEHYAQKIAAEDAAKGVFGVKGTANGIMVELAGDGKRTDRDVATAALNALKWDYDVPEDKVKVVVKNGWVTLEGTVDWQYQKDCAERCVRYLMGVVAVSNNVAIKPSVKWIITLSGSVASWAESDEAATAAWSAPGATSVRNDLVISS